MRGSVVEVTAKTYFWYKRFQAGRIAREEIRAVLEGKMLYRIDLQEAIRLNRQNSVSVLEKESK